MVCTVRSRRRNRGLIGALMALALTLPAKAADSDRERDFLSGATKGCPNCSLERAALKRWDLSGQDLTGAHLAAAVLHRARLAGTKLSGADLTGANLNKADL